MTLSCLPTCTYSLNLECGANLVHKKKKKVSEEEKRETYATDWVQKMLSLAGKEVNGAQLLEQKVSFKGK